MATGSGKALHARWLRKQIQLAKKRAAKADATDMEHGNAMKRLAKLEAESARLHARKARAPKKKKSSKKRKR